MTLTQDRRSSVRTDSVSLILPQMPGSNLADHVVAEYRRILEAVAGFQFVEVIVSSARTESGPRGPDRAFRLRGSARASDDPRQGRRSRLARARAGGFDGGGRRAPGRARYEPTLFP